MVKQYRNPSDNLLFICIYIRKNSLYIESSCSNEARGDGELHQLRPRPRTALLVLFIKGYLPIPTFYATKRCIPPAKSSPNGDEIMFNENS